MHIPSTFKETRQDSLYQLIRDYPLGTLIASITGELDADHIPFYLHQPDSGAITLQSHIAKANNLWRQADDGQRVLLIFQGPNAYISPNFYPSKQETANSSTPTSCGIPFEPCPFLKHQRFTAAIQSFD